MKRFHLHVSVKDLDESVQFYSTPFAQQPAVRQTDRQPVGVNHLGFQLDSDAELRGMQAKLHAAD